MAIGVLLDDEQHSFIHDLESFFWILFWICIHYDGPSKERDVPQFGKWKYVDTKELATTKKGTVVDERDFIDMLGADFTRYYQPLIPWVKRLWRVVLPGGIHCVLKSG
jgi:hypothetical protein